jgi:hypothetical protein
MKPAEELPMGTCPRCEKLIAIGQETCPVCNTPLDMEPVGVVPIERLPTLPERPLQFGISSMLLIVTLTAVVLSMGAVHPGLGIAGAILAVPALVRACVLANPARHGGRPLSAGKKLTLFLASVAVVAVVIGAGGAAFFFTCLVVAAPGAMSRSSDGSVFFCFGLLLGAVAAMFTTIAVIRRLAKASARRGEERVP